MGDPGLSRRAVMIGGVALAGSLLAACASPGPPPAVTAPRPTPSLIPLPTPTPEPVAPPLPDVEAVIAAHEGRVPTHWGLEFPGVITTGHGAGSPEPDRVFLTLDACGGPAGSGFDERLIAGLQAAGVPATLFLNLRWIEANSAVAHALAADPLFELGNHGTDHLPLSVTGHAAYGIPGTASVRAAAMEVWHNHVALSELTGAQPRWFRPGTAHLDDVGLSIAESLGERVLGFSVNGDGGATAAAASVAAEVGAAVPGAVVIAHMNHPASGTADGILAALPTLQQRGITLGTL